MLVRAILSSQGSPVFSSSEEVSSNLNLNPKQSLYVCMYVYGCQRKTSGIVALCVCMPVYVYDMMYMHVHVFVNACAFMLSCWS